MLKEISIHNFKCLRNTGHIGLSKINLLTGINGQGKSSFLQTLLVLSQTWRKSNYDIISPSDSDLISLGGYADIHNASAIDEPMRIHMITDDPTDNDFEVAYTRNDPHNDIGELLYFKVGGQSPMDDGEEMTAEEEECMEEDAHAESDTQAKESTPILSLLSDHPSLMALKNVYYVAANRQPASDRYTPPTGRSASDLRPDGSNVLDVMAWLGKEKIREIEAMLKRIFGDARIDLHSISDNTYELKMDSRTTDGRMFSPSNVGYGFGYVLTMLTAMLMMHPGDTFIIENPEAHLHPGAQAEVMRLIVDHAVNNNIQVFVETHSDHIVNGSLVAVRQREDFTNEDLDILFFSNTGISNLEITPRGHILNPPEDFCSQYARDIDILYPVDEWEK